MLTTSEHLGSDVWARRFDHRAGEHLFEAVERIHADEVVHVAFHSATLPEQLQRSPRPVHALARLVWSILAVGAALVVARDHGRLLVRVGVPRRRFLRRVLAGRRRVASAMFRR